MEMEIEGEGDESPQMVITTEEDEEVVLYWHNGARSKPIRDLATGYQDGNAEDKATLDYYRYCTKAIARLLHYITVYYITAHYITVHYITVYYFTVYNSS